MVIDEQVIGAVRVIRPVGPISGETDTGAFRARTDGLAMKSQGRLVLDATELSFVDSAGLESLLELAESLERVGQCLKLGGAGDTLRETIHLTELSEHFEWFDRVQDAVRSFR